MKVPITSFRQTMLMLNMIDEEHADYKLAVQEMLDTCLRIAVKAGTLTIGKDSIPSLAGVITTALRAAVTMAPDTNETSQLIGQCKRHSRWQRAATYCIT